MHSFFGAGCFVNPFGVGVGDFELGTSLVRQQLEQLATIFSIPGHGLSSSMLSGAWNRCAMIVVASKSPEKYSGCQAIVNFFRFAHRLFALAGGLFFDLI